MENINDTTEELQNLQVDKNTISELASNLAKQHNSLVGLLNTRIQQLDFFYHNLEKYNLNEIVSRKEIEAIIVSTHGLSINIEDAKASIDKLDYSKLFEKYDSYISASVENNDNIDLDILGAEIHDEMQGFFKDTESIGAIIDVLTETYTTEVQIKIDGILRRIKTANDKLEVILGDELKDILDIKDTAVGMAENIIEEQEEIKTTQGE